MAESLPSEVDAAAALLESVAVCPPSEALDLLDDVQRRLSAALNGASSSPGGQGQAAGPAAPLP